MKKMLMILFCIAQISNVALVNGTIKRTKKPSFSQPSTFIARLFLGGNNKNS